MRHGGTMRSGLGRPSARMCILRPSRGRQQGIFKAKVVGTDDLASSASLEGQHAMPLTVDFHDPDSKFKRYGSFFGGGYKWTPEWMQDVPRVRVRTSESRKMNELLDLAVLNERLAGNLEPWEARSKLEYLKMRRKNWEFAYELISKSEETATLAVIEDAFKRAEELQSAETTSIGDMKRQLTELKSQVDDAQLKLRATQGRVEQNLQHINQLRAEAMFLEHPSTPPALPAATVSKAVAVSRPQPAVPAAPAGNNRPSTSYTPSVSSMRAPAQKRNIGLQSSLVLEEQLKTFWYPSEFSSRLKKDLMLPIELFGEPWVLFRDAAGAPACVRDQCAHRACPLSIGRVVDGNIECAYHGWQFRGDGECVKMPSTQQCRNVAVAALPCVEKDGFVWVWPGQGMPSQVPDFTLPPKGYDIHAEIVVEVPVEHGLLIENLLDLAHAPFTHTATFAKGWPVPDFVKFHADRLLSGTWDPYPIDMAFLPPCMTLSVIGLAQPGQIMRGMKAENCEKHLHQLHVCVPSKPGHTRLLYRMSLDFLPWLKHVPFIDRVWNIVAGQVLGEDMPLVLGQQDRMIRGGDTWSLPVSYDKLAVRYRRWRNTVASGDEGSDVESPQPMGMSAGELFSIDEAGDLEDEGSCLVTDEWQTY